MSRKYEYFMSKPNQPPKFRISLRLNSALKHAIVRSTLCISNDQSSFKSLAESILILTLESMKSHDLIGGSLILNFIV